MTHTSKSIYPEIHNLQFYRSGLPHHYWDYRSEFEFNVHYHQEFGFKREVTVLYGEHESSVTVWLGASDNPLTFEDFKHLLSYIEGATGLKVWSELEHWIIKRYGVNIDGKKFEESPAPTLLLSCFAGWFAQQYDKDLTDEQGNRIKLRRSEIEGRNAITADKFIALVTGGMTNTQIMNLVALQNQQIDRLQREVRSMGTYFERALKELLKDRKDREGATPAPVIRNEPK